jgi:hypothetical protein
MLGNAFYKEKAVVPDYSEQASTIMLILIRNYRDFTQYDFYTIAGQFGVPHGRRGLLGRLYFYKFEKSGQIVNTGKTRACGQQAQHFDIWEATKGR